MNMRTFCALALGAVVLVGCSDDDVTGFNTDCSNLLGTFSASTATITGTGAAGTTVNLLADSSRLDLAFGQGSFSSSYRRGANGEPAVASGTFSSSTQDKLQVNGLALFPGGSLSSAFTCKIDGDVLTLEDPKSTYTFAGTSESAPARVTIRANRTGE